MKQPSLFDGFPLDEAPATPGLVRIQSPGGKLNPKQKRFNQLTRKIESLQKRIADRRLELDGLMKEYRRTIPPLEAQEAAKARSLAFGLDEEAARRKCSRSMRKDLEDCILYFLEMSLGHDPDDPEALALFQRWAGLSYDEVLEAEEDETAALLSDFCKEVLEVEVDQEILKQGPEALMAHLEAQAFEDPPPPPRRPRKKSAKQIQREQQTKAAESLAQRTVRSVYIGLAKILHPDAEPDPVLRAEKEQLMKQLTEAKDRNDLYTLLQLEMTWLHREEGHLDRLPEATLDLYLAYLKEQAAGLEEELRSISFAPAFSELGAFPSRHALRQAKHDLAFNCELLDEAIRDLPRFSPAYLKSLAKMLN